MMDESKKEAYTPEKERKHPNVSLSPSHGQKLNSIEHRQSFRKESDNESWMSESKGKVRDVVIPKYFGDSDIASKKRKLKRSQSWVEKFQTSLKDSIIILQAAQNEDNREVNAQEKMNDRQSFRRETAIQVLGPKNISMTCGYVKYDFNCNNWQIFYRLPASNNCIVEVNDQRMEMSSSNANTSLSYLSRLKSIIPTPLLLHCEPSSSGNKWKLILEISWFANLHKTILNRTKSIQFVAHLQSSTEQKHPPPNYLIQNIMEKIEFFTLLSIAEITHHIKLKNSRVESPSPLMISMRNGQLVDFSSLFLFFNSNKPGLKNQESEDDLFPRKKFIHILRYAKEIILSSLIFNINSSISEAESIRTVSLSSSEQQYSNLEGHTHSFQHIAAETVKACLSSEHGALKKQKLNEIPKIQKQLGYIKEKDLNSGKRMETDEPDLNSEISNGGSLTPSSVVSTIHDISKTLSKNKLLKEKQKQIKPKKHVEISGITESYTVPQTSKSDTVNQLFVNDFSVSSFLTSSSSCTTRPKRQIKTVMRFEAKPAHCKNDLLKASTVKIGEGFNCPRCDYWLSYDCIKCDDCELKCKYQAGIGVVVFKDRNDISSNEIFERMKTVEKSNHSQSISHDDDLKKMPNLNSKKQTTKICIKSTKTSQINMSVDQGNKECEVCFVSLRPNSFSTHRKLIHGLSSMKMGCPYCKETFLTPEARFSHIDMNHPNQKAYLPGPACKKKRLKAIIRCTVCWQSFLSMIDVRRHILYGHGEKFVYENLKYVCPFCPREFMVKPFNSYNFLLDHVKKSHEGCCIEQDALAEELNASSKASSKKEEKEQEAEFDKNATKQKINKRQTRTSNRRKKQPTKKLHSLNIAPFLIENDYNKRVFDGNISKGIQEVDDVNIDSALDKVKLRLKILSRRATPKSSSYDDDEYHAEISAYKRSLRDRVANQEHERCEKEKYKAKSESDRLVQAYMNRNKKRTKEDFERSSLETRQIRYVSKTAWKNAGHRKCDIVDCSLCGIEYAQMILLDEDLHKRSNSGNSDVSISCKSLQIENPRFRELPEEFLFCTETLFSENEQQHQEPVSIKSNLKSSKSSEKEIGKQANLSKKYGVVEENMRLKLLNDTLHFVKEYNEGLLKNKKA